jgi:hypothetical protein
MLLGLDCQVIYFVLRGVLGANSLLASINPYVTTSIPHTLIKLNT